MLHQGWTVWTLGPWFWPLCTIWAGSVQSGWLCRWFMDSTSLNTWASGWSKTCSLLERPDPSRWKRYWNQIKSSHNDAKGWIILVTELDYTCNWTQMLPNVMIWIFPGFQNNLKGIYVHRLIPITGDFSRLWFQSIDQKSTLGISDHSFQVWASSDLGDIIVSWWFWGGVVGMAAQMPARNKNWRLLTLLTLLTLQTAHSPYSACSAQCPRSSSWERDEQLGFVQRS